MIEDHVAGKDDKDEIKNLVQLNWGEDPIDDDEEDTEEEQRRIQQ